MSGPNRRLLTWAHHQDARVERLEKHLYDMGVDYSDIEGPIYTLEEIELGDRLEEDFEAGGLTVGDLIRRPDNEGDS